MASTWTSSAFATTNTYIKYKISITQNSQSIANNTSNVTVKVRFYRTNTGYTTYGTGTVTCKINGTTYTASVTSSQKITSSGIVLFSKTLNISHGSDGTKTLSVVAKISHSQFSSSNHTYSHALSTIARKSTLSVAAGTMGTAQTLTVTRQSTSLTHTITYYCETTSGDPGEYGTICDKSSSTSISFAPPLSLAYLVPSATSVQISYTITTYSGTTSIGSNTYTTTVAVPSSIVPICNISVNETTGYQSKFGALLKGMSKLTVTVSGSGSYGSSINGYSSTFAGATYTSSSFTVTVNTTGTITIDASVRDTRGRWGYASYTVGTATTYTSPKVSSLTVSRCDSDGTSNMSGAYCKVTFNASVDRLTVSNSNMNYGYYTVYYKKTSASSWTSVRVTTYDGQFTISGGTYIFAADTDSSYNVQLQAADKLGSGWNATVLSTAFALMHFSAGGTGIAIGKIVESENKFDVGLPANFLGDITYSGNLTKSSDIREKNPLGDLTEEEMLAILSGSEMHKFTYKADESQIVNYGVYAQQLRDLLISSGLGHMAMIRMELKNTDNETTTDLTTDEEKVKYTVDYLQYIPFLIAGWQYQQRKIAELERKILEMKEGDSNAG